MGKNSNTYRKKNSTTIKSKPKRNRSTRKTTKKSNRISSRTSTSKNKNRNRNRNRKNRKDSNRKRTKTRGGGNGCSSKPNYSSCKECVEDWYWELTEDITNKFHENMDNHRNNIKFQVDDIDKEYENAINSSEGNPELADLIAKEYDKHREERKQIILEKIEDTMKQEFKKTIRKIRTNEQNNKLFKDMMDQCEKKSDKSNRQDLTQEDIDRMLRKAKKGL